MHTLALVFTKILQHFSALHGDTLFEFKCLCFGISSAPRIFTKILKPVYAFFRQLGIRCIYYIDDSLIMNQHYYESLKRNAHH